MVFASWKWKLALVVSCLLGLLGIVRLHVRLDLQFHAKSLPQVEAIKIKEGATKRLAPLRPVDVIVLPQATRRDDLYQYALKQLLGHLRKRSGATPRVVYGQPPPSPCLALLIGAPSRNQVSPKIQGPKTQEGFVWEGVKRGEQELLLLQGGSRLGDAYGMYRLAERLQTLSSWKELFHRRFSSSPTMKYRFVGLGGIGIKPDQKAWLGRDYSHHARAFRHLIKHSPAAVDPVGFARMMAHFKQYVHQMLAYGNNGLIIGGFLEYINFDRVGTGRDIYAADSPYRARHLVLRKAFGELFRYAHAMGMRVVLKTDMVALTGPLRRYFHKHLGGIDTNQAGLWKVYQAGLEELFTVFPFVDGLMLRVGEAGAVYNLKGWDYSSALYVRTDRSVRRMLRAFLEVAAKRQKTIIFRTWSVGVGQVGNIHTIPATYLRVLSKIESPHLVVSTKYIMGDFDSYLPFNPTLFHGKHKRIIEFQGRREFEAFNAFPNFVGGLHQSALRTFRRKNKHIVGMWTWSQAGGPPRIAPMALYPFFGFWHMTDANVYATSRLGWYPNVRMDDVLLRWARRYWGDEPGLATQVAKVMAMSRKAVLKGFYIGPFARKQVFALGLEPPPMLWIFKWDMVTGASAPLSTIYATCRTQLKEAIAEGFSAVALVEQMQALLAPYTRREVGKQKVFQYLWQSLAYERDVFLTLALYRRTFLSYYHWLDTGTAVAYQHWQESIAPFHKQQRAHVKKYIGSVDFRPYRFFAVEAGMRHAQKSVSMAWGARVLLLILLVLWGVGLSLSVGRREDWQTWTLGLLSPWRLGPLASTSRAHLWTWSLLVSCLFVCGVGLLASFVAWRFALCLSLATLGWAYLYVGLHGWESGRRWPLLASVLSPMLATMATILGPMAVRGPGYFFYMFWTQETLRSVWVFLFAGSIGWLWFAMFTASGVLGESRWTRRMGHFLVASGCIWMVSGGLAMLWGLERCLTALNDEMALLPMGLSRILGITTHLNIPTRLPLWVICLGLLSCVLGALLRGRKAQPSVSG